MPVMICLLCTAGVYFVRGNPFDLLIMAIAGIIRCNMQPRTVKEI